MESNDEVAGINDESLPGKVRAGDRILVDDGLPELTIMGVFARDATTRVISGGMVRNRSGASQRAILPPSGRGSGSVDF